ncbi:MAG TPA: glutamine-hydrolyzing carbamoyl-phosphate synthase small subunit [Thermoanaerobaculia bacterium]|nr:glutamine-hydrolyzing carbamoyl-phosphate synthase small subunit [Thermoanaerobaculia bacterium]
MTLLSPERNGLLLLEDGSVFEGRAAAPGTRFGEVVFNTAMTGYQEILTDPSYFGQIVVMTQPQMGNYGVCDEACESSRIWAEGMVARRLARAPSNHSAERSLPSWLRDQAIPALEAVDTRALVRRLREHGALRGVVTSERSEIAPLLAELREFPSMVGRALVEPVTTSRPYEVSPSGPERCHLAVYDFGVKRNILRSLQSRGARLSVLPARTSSAECLAAGVDGVVLSNGPGDPQPLMELIEIVRDLVASRIPILGICLGHQLLGLALGAKTFKLKFGHHGGNQPVRQVATGRIRITSQNHGFAVGGDSLPAGCVATETNLNDGTLEALRVASRPIFSCQYHPEAAPGPHESAALFDEFLAAVASGQGTA